MKKFLLCVAALMGYASASMAANFSFTIGETGISVVAPQVSCDFTDSKVRAFIVTGASGSTVTEGTGRHHVHSGCSGGQLQRVQCVGRLL